MATMKRRGEGAGLQNCEQKRRGIITAKMEACIGYKITCITQLCIYCISNKVSILICIIQRSWNVHVNEVCINALMNKVY
jgi:hypothetical protein